MSKKAFKPGSAAPTPESAQNDTDPDVRMKKVSSSSNQYKTGGGEKLVGGSSGPGYNFTGITPGSE